MVQMPSDARLLIAIRVIVVTTLLLVTLIIQYTVGDFLPISYLYFTAGVAYILTLVYILLGKLFRSRKLNLMVQIFGDLVVETLLVYFTGGLDSPFSFLYLVSIITASMLLYRRGGILAVLRPSDPDPSPIGSRLIACDQPRGGPKGRMWVGFVRRRKPPLRTATRLTPNAAARPRPFRATNRYAPGRSSPLPMGEGQPTSFNASTTTPSVSSCGNTRGSADPGAYSRYSGTPDRP